MELPPDLGYSAVMDEFVRSWRLVSIKPATQRFPGTGTIEWIARDPDYTRLRLNLRDKRFALLETTWPDASAVLPEKALAKLLKARVKAELRSHKKESGRHVRDVVQITKDGVTKAFEKPVSIWRALAELD